MATWSQILSLSLSTGLAWNLLAGRLGALEQYQVVASLMRADEIRYDAIAIGDGLFLEQVRKHLPDEARVLPVLIPRYDARDLYATLGAVSRVNAPLLLLQGSPFLWTNMETDAAHSGIGQDVDLWDALDDHATWPFPLKDVELFFQVVQVAAKDRPAKQVIDSRRPTTLDRLSLDLSPFSRLMSRLDGIEDREICWIDDRAELDLASNPALLRAFDEAKADKEIPAGRYVDWDQIGDEIARQATSAGVSEEPPG